MDGRAPDAVGARLGVPSYRCGARHVSVVTGIRTGLYRLGGTVPSEA
ncbi:hypothetical protein ACWD4X_09280 [Streptomyces termitum]